jgi:AAA domain
MNKLKIDSFKAFETAVVIPLDGLKNLLLYGENGAGKSSIYQAIKVAFFKDRLEGGITAPTPEDREQLVNAFWSDFNNKVSNRDFMIEVDDVNYKITIPASHQVFMISLDELADSSDSINLKSLLKRFYLNIADIDQLCADKFQDIQNRVNQALASFIESIAIEIDEQDGFNIKLTNVKKNIERKQELRKYFNEAKLNVIVLLILLSTIDIAKDTARPKILVLDDFITSLDVSNRTFLVKYIFETFQDAQILIFTHNISFYNLIMYMIRDIYQTAENWAFANLYEIDNSHKLYIKSEIERVKDLKDTFGALSGTSTAAEIETLGNRVRKKFEVLLYEYSKLLMIGTVEDSKKILDRIIHGKSAFYNVGKTATDLIDSIGQLLDENNPNNLDGRIRSKIDGFRNDGLANFKKILTDLKLYQKVTMHPMSHGTAGITVFTIKELKKSIELLEKMETYLKEMVDQNVVAV